MTGSKSLQQWARDSVVLLLAEFAIVAGLFHYLLLSEPSPTRPILPLQIIIRRSHIGHAHVFAVVLDLLPGV
jgi:hypothetical protein